MESTAAIGLIALLAVAAAAAVIWGRQKAARAEMELLITRGELDAARSRIGETETKFAAEQAGHKASNEQLDNTRTELETTKNELNTTRGKLGETETKFAAEQAGHKASNEQLDDTRTKLETTQNELDAARGKLSDTETELAAVRADHEARKEELAKAREDLDKQFKGLATSVLKESTETLLKQADEQFKGHRQLSAADLEKRQQAINSLVEPLSKSLEKLDASASEMEKTRVGAYEKLTSQVESLQKAAGSLNDTLRSPNARGKWGEQHLYNILELSGLREGTDYHTQLHLSGEDNAVRPDAVVNVPKGLKVVIDAKAPLKIYDKALEAEDDERERELLNSHASNISDHAKKLGLRDYSKAVASVSSNVMSPDFVLMFLPADAILDSAMKVQPTLWENAWREHRVLIATPGLLLAFLRTVATAWQQQEIQKNAQEIADQGRLLYDRLRTFAEHVDGVGKGLSRALNSYNKAVGSFESRVMSQARRFEELGAAPDSKPIPELARVDGSVRAMKKQDDIKPKLATDETISPTSRPHGRPTAALPELMPADEDHGRPSPDGNPS